MNYQIFKLCDSSRSIIQSMFLITNIEMSYFPNEEFSDEEIEVIELNKNGLITSSFFDKNEFLYTLAKGHHFWGEIEGLTKAISLCEKEMNHDKLKRLSL